MFGKLLKLKLSERLNYFEKKIILLIFSILLIFGCAPEEESKSTKSRTYSINAVISGLNGTLVLSNGTGEDNVYDSSEAIAITEDGDYSFSGMEAGKHYNISILQQPIAQTCRVNEESGILNADISITVNCEANATLGGTVNGLVGSVTLQKNSDEEINITSNGQFYFGNPVNIGDSYIVTAKDSKSSTGQICSASNNKGVVKGNVENIQITCSSVVRTISGNIKNLSGTLILQNNFGGDQTFSENSSFTFFVADGAQFNIYVKSQPKGKCVVSNGKGTAIADVSNVEVDCWSLVDGVNSGIGINHDSSLNGDGVYLHQFSTKLYATWSEKNSYNLYQIRVKSYDNSSWIEEDGAGSNGINIFKSFKAVNPVLADNGTNLVAVWQEDDGNGKDLIPWSKQDSYKNWNCLPERSCLELNKNKYSSNYDSETPTITVYTNGSNNTTYSSWVEKNNSGVKQIRVSKYNNNSTWSIVDGDDASSGINFDSTKNSVNPFLKGFNNELYAIWSEDNSSSYQIRVAKFDNSSSWNFKEGTNCSGNNCYLTDNKTGLNKSTGSGSNPMLEVFNNNLYAIWSEENTDNRTQIRVSKYNGNSNSPSWSFVDGNDANKGINKDYRNNASHPKLVVANSNLYAVWLEENGSTQVRVAQFDNSSSWTFKDGDGFDGLNVNTARVTGKASAAEYNNQLYVAWSETNDNNTTQIRVARAPF